MTEAELIHEGWAHWQPAWEYPSETEDDLDRAKRLNVPIYRLDRDDFLKPDGTTTYDQPLGMTPIRPPFRCRKRNGTITYDKAHLKLYGKTHG